MYFFRMIISIFVITLSGAYASTPEKSIDLLCEIYTDTDPVKVITTRLEGKKYKYKYKFPSWLKNSFSELISLERSYGNVVTTIDELDIFLSKPRILDSKSEVVVFLLNDSHLMSNIIASYVLHDEYIQQFVRKNFVVFVEDRGFSESAWEIVYKYKAIPPSMVRLKRNQGIWTVKNRMLVNDCISVSDVSNFLRYKINEGKKKVGSE
ncbi:MAG: hypothetical protein RPU42_00175 [Candidatus Sedimenticola sp. (ex Thyasira tokunagai)]